LETRPFREEDEAELSSTELDCVLARGSEHGVQIGLRTTHRSENVSDSFEFRSDI
jgi:hypothetical protein